MVAVAQFAANFGVCVVWGVRFFASLLLIWSLATIVGMISRVLQ